MVFEGRPNIVDLLIDRKISIVMNTTEGEQSIIDSKDIRQLALDKKIPYYTTARGIIAAIFSLKENKKYDYLVKSIISFEVISPLIVWIITRFLSSSNVVGIPDQLN